MSLIRLFQIALRGGRDQNRASGGEMENCTRDRFYFQLMSI